MLKNCPNSQFFLVRISSHLDWILLFSKFPSFQVWKTTYQKNKAQNKIRAPFILWNLWNINPTLHKKRSFPLTLSWRRPLSDRNQSSDLLCKSMDWFLLYDNGLRHERVSYFFCKCHQIHRKLRIWSHLMQKYLVETFIFRAVEVLKTKWKTQKKAVFILSIYWHVKTGFYMIEYNYTPLFISYLSICWPNKICYSNEF